MKLIAGQKYIRGPNNEIVPYSPAAESIAGNQVFVQKEDYEDTLQLTENDRKPFRGRDAVIKQGSIEEGISEAKPLPKGINATSAPKQSSISTPKPKKVDHWDVREDMRADLSGLA